MSWEGDKTAGDYLTVASNAIWNFGTTTDFSISMWIKRITDEGANEHLMSRSGDADGFRCWIRATDFVRMIVAGGTTIQAGTITVDGNWHHLVYTVDRDGTLDVYIDNVVNVNAGTFNGDVTNANPLRLNANSSAGAQESARYEDVAIYDTLLTAAQIASIYNGRLSHAFFPNNRISWWPLHVPGDATYHAAANGDLGMQDHSLNSNHLTVGTAGTWAQDSPGLQWPSTPLAVPAVLAAPPAVTRQPRPGLIIGPGVAA